MIPRIVCFESLSGMMSFFLEAVSTEAFHRGLSQEAFHRDAFHRGGGPKQAPQGTRVRVAVHMIPRIPGASDDS